LITSDISQTKNIFNDLETYKPKHIAFRQIIKGEIDIGLRDPNYTHRTIDITFKGLTDEQISRLDKIKKWC